MHNKEEIWKPIVLPIDLSKRFEISNYGNVRRIGRIVPKTGKIKQHSPVPVKICNPKRRYLKLRVRFGFEQYRNLLIHRLVGLHFIPNPQNKPQINHKDANKHNNHVSNLEWVTQSENIRHAQSIGIMPYAKPKQNLEKWQKKSSIPVYKKVINIENGEVYENSDIVAGLLQTSKRNVQRQLCGSRYCYIPYRYLGEEDIVKFKPIRIKKEKPHKKERPPRKVYVHHPLVLKKIIQMDKYGNVIKIWDSVRAAALSVNSVPDTFRRAIKKSPKNITKGYIWEYVF